MNKPSNVPHADAPAYLHTFPNHHRHRDYFVQFTHREFSTEPCPLTGLPQYATLHIAYLPDAHIIKNSALVQYLASYRNHGDYHEDCINRILDDLVHWISPKYLEVAGQFTPHSSIHTQPYANYGRPGTPYEALAQERLRRRHVG